MQHIIIAGSGFAGLMTIQTLRRNGCTLPITLVAPRLEMFYPPAMIWLSAGLYTVPDLTFALDGFCRHYAVDYVAGSVIGLNATKRQLRTTAGEMQYEKLVIATGGHSLKQLPGIEHSFIPCDSCAQIMAMTKRLATLTKGTLAFGFAGNPAEPTAIRSEILFEFLLGVDTLLRRQKRREQFNLVLFTPCQEIDFRWGPRAGQLQHELTRRGIISYLGQPLEGFCEDRVILADRDIKSDLIVFIPEMVGADWVKYSDLPLSTNAFIRADASCRVLGFADNVYVAGDAGDFPGPDWIPKQGHMADLHAQALALNLISDIHGVPTNQRFRQEFICIVDAMDSAILIFRDQNRSMLLRGKVLHWVKRVFIWAYLYKYKTWQKR